MEICDIFSRFKDAQYVLIYASISITIRRLMNEVEEKVADGEISKISFKTTGDRIFKDI